ncbi:MAG TPA: patatin-like phospholipase family protein [Chthoniobacterales bacterium]|nr:patatin-like phospholipase family protein [Chthoniobacterales bacterium]
MSDEQPMKRLLALDGGGIRGVFSLEILARIEAHVRAARGQPDLVLADYFDYIAGTSTGAIIATCLSWGMSVAEVLDLYTNRAVEIFRPAPLYRRFWNKFEAEAITRMFKMILSEDGEGKEPSLLGTKKLRTLLTLVMRNHTTGSPWPVSNNPAAKYNDPNRPTCNLVLPLWQLVRASTAAPVYFPPETIELGGVRHVFVDGAITPYNNPALLLFSMATLPQYNLNWPTGADKMLLVSVGTGRSRTGAGELRGDQMNLLFTARSVPMALMDSISLQQDIMCRTLGHCLEGAPIDNELGDLRGEIADIGRKQFSYVRYDHLFTTEELTHAKTLNKAGITLDNLAMMPFLRELGARYADKHVHAEHLR